MALKNFLDWSEFAQTHNAVSLFKQSIRESLKFDAYGDRTTFSAIALTNSYELSEVEAIGYGAAASDLLIGGGLRYKFKARVIIENTPHSFIPDPCALSQPGADKAGALSLVCQHIDVIQINASGNMVAMGDIIEIEMLKNVFCYDLQLAKFNRIIARNSGAKNLLPELACDALYNTFGKLPEELKGTETLTDITNISKSPGLGKLFTGPKSFLQTVGPAVAAVDSSLRIIVTSHYRGPMKQAKAMLGKVKKGEFSALYSSSTACKGANANGCVEFLREAEGDASLLVLSNIVNSYQQRNGLFSDHQTAGALDLRTQGLTDKQVRTMAKVMDNLGASWSLEPHNGWNSRSNAATLARTGTNTIANEDNGQHMHVKVPSTFMNGTKLPSLPPLIDIDVPSDGGGGTDEDEVLPPGMNPEDEISDDPMQQLLDMADEDEEDEEEEEDDGDTGDSD